jgi:hypothetical protein
MCRAKELSTCTVNHMVHQLYSDDPPSGVTIDEWLQVRVVLGRVVSVIGNAGPYFMVEWGFLEDKESVCQVVMALLNLGKSPMAVEDLLTDGNYLGCTYPVQELYLRARNYIDQCAVNDAPSDVSQTGNATIDEAQNELAIAFSARYCLNE